ncbi:ABC transporter permease [Labedella phragmitis]|uniref:ABC transporter permease n=1 Tax=Labedella phragmitis TaxID=2498849 RepID=A0A3S3ZMX7_9MICO|nr:methionine ABC transporter permease [Labedella phragmitis]RWZ49603.1 ABC transporter permease [Labedella phragmitis]
MDAVIDLAPLFAEAAFETLWLVFASLLFGGIGGLIVGLALYVTRAGNLFANRVVFGVLNVIVNIFRPIPFIIFLTAFQPLARLVIGTGIGTEAAIFTISLASTFGISRIVEQNLLTVSPGVIEAARAAGAGPLRTILTIVIPEALGPLILGYTFVFVAIVDMSAVAGVINGGGLGAFAIQYGFRQFEPAVTWTSLAIVIILVQVVQFLGNGLARKVLRR